MGAFVRVGLGASSRERDCDEMLGCFRMGSDHHERGGKVEQWVSPVGWSAGPPGQEGEFPRDRFIRLSRLRALVNIPSHIAWFRPGGSEECVPEQVIHQKVDNTLTSKYRI
jgi:hypothetical protein